ncbi:GDSL esterase/lipase At3g27950-like [Rutidosis leptorrhynchoides]|uniref:GDSL esterase/lipase At3g27950-like n=1 Tax=Rutidosis leptorrhynchoides TaxID=125765 RepID=UPI003A992E36
MAKVTLGDMSRQGPNWWAKLKFKEPDDRKCSSGSQLQSYASFRSPNHSKKKRVMAIAIIVVVLLTCSLIGSATGCQFPAIYNFGDSNSDSGGVSATFGRVPYPNGETFFHKQSARHSDGRLIIDFIAEKLGLPLLHAYLDALNPSYRYGANFALSGSTIQLSDSKVINAYFNPMSLTTQIFQFKQFKNRTITLYNKGSHIRSSLPRPKDFSKALYSIDIGQNDVHFGLTTMEEEQVKASFPNIINRFASLIQELYQEGARKFWIHNTGPIGCMPLFIINFPPKSGNADENGCIKSYNQVAQEFNNQLKQKVAGLRTNFPDATLVLVDIYSAKYTLINEARQNGFVDPVGYCCGIVGVLGCGGTAIVNGTKVFGASCSNPSNYISWDGIHYTDAANQWVTNSTIHGYFTDPPISLTQACSFKKGNKKQN